MGFETSGPNEAMIVSGLGYSSPAMIPGGRVWVWPCIQQIQVNFAFFSFNHYREKIYQKFSEFR